jgi:mono/diheme cytochrome c family protein
VALTVLLAALAFALFAACGGDPVVVVPTPAPSPTPDPEIVLGRTVYDANCATCHGLAGEGETDWQTRRPDATAGAPPHDSTGHTWHHADGQLFEIVSRGGKLYETPTFKSRMEPFNETLSPAEIRAVLEYIKTFWGPRELASQTRMSLQLPYPDP